MALDGLRLGAASEETVKQAQLMALKAFAQQVLRIHILMFLHGSVLHGSPFIQRAIETKRRDLFPAPSHLQVSQSRHPANLFSSFLWRVGKPRSHGNTVLPAPGPLL